MNRFYRAYLQILLLSSVLCSGASFAQQAPADDEMDGEASGQDVVRYVTVRDKIVEESGSIRYGDSRGKLQAGICRIDSVDIPLVGDLSDSASFYIPDEINSIEGVTEFTDEEFWQEIEQFSEQEQGRIVLYVHGYNIGFEKSCRRAAVFQRALGEGTRLILFSWPADGSVFKYTRDETDLVWSIFRLADFMQRLVKHVGGHKIDVVGHSLGARGLAIALAALSRREWSSKLVDNLVLFAPDIDRDNFLEIWPWLSRLVTSTTLYVSENDKALKLSHQLHGYPRLGEAGDDLTIIQGIETIDISAAGVRRFSGHLYHLYNPVVVDDLELLLRSGLPAAERPNLQRIELPSGAYWRLIPDEQ